MVYPYNPYSAGIDFRRRYLTSKVDPRAVRLTSKVDPRAVRVKNI